MRLWAACLALLACSGVLGTPEHDAINDIEQRGGQVHFTVGRTCDSCERGALASRPFAPGDVIALVPAAATLAVGPGSLPEEALKLLAKLHADPALNQTFSAFLGSLPGLTDMLAPASLAPAELAELHMPELERLVTRQQRELAAVFSKEAEGAPWLTLQQLHHMTALLRTRSFSSLLGARRMVPAVDMLNHHQEPNAEVEDDAKGGAVLLRALRPIAQGEELLLRYKSGVLHRDDAALFFYGYLPEEASPPRLCALDLPTHNAANPWRRTDATDDWYVPMSAGGWLADLQLLREYARLTGLLAGLPTTEQQDELVLAGGELAGGWKQRELVRFRLRRKRALRHALERMEAAWDAAHPAAGLRALCGRGSEARQAESSGGGCGTNAARLAARLNPGSVPAALPGALLQPLGALALAALQLRRPGVLLGRPDVLLLLASGAAFLYMTRQGGGRRAV